MKDALEETIQAFALLRDEEVLKLEFHICGVGKLAKQIIKENKLENSPAGKIVIHEWMPYEELIDLYRRAHFMILARDISRMTLANFPSKIPETLSYGIIPIVPKRHTPVDAVMSIFPSLNSFPITAVYSKLLFPRIL